MDPIGIIILVIILLICPFLPIRIARVVIFGIIVLACLVEYAIVSAFLVEYTIPLVIIVGVLAGVWAINKWLVNKRKE